MSAPGAARVPGDERGASLAVVLFVLLLASMLGVAVLFTTDLELRTSRSYGEGVLALVEAESGVEEALWRLGLAPGPEPPPAGSRVSVNELVAYDARIDWDPLRLLSNGDDDDADGAVDEPDELNLGREWAARVLLVPREVHPGAPWEVGDGEPAAGPPWGSRVVLPTVQPQASWREYSTAEPSESDSLTVRFKLDVDTALGDSEGDGPEVVFFNPLLATDPIPDRNTLTGLGEGVNPLDDSPYNITWGTGLLKTPASGRPVLLVRATGWARRGGAVTLVRRVEAEVVPESPPRVIAWREIP